MVITWPIFSGLYIGSLPKDLGVIPELRKKSVLGLVSVWMRDQQVIPGLPIAWQVEKKIPKSNPNQFRIITKENCMDAGGRKGKLKKKKKTK